MKTIRYCLLAASLIFVSGSLLAGSKISWKERDNRILPESVCFNHGYGSIEYRTCRVDAARHFKEKCSYYRNKYKTTKYPYNKKFIPNRDKFCIRFSPVS